MFYCCFFLFCMVCLKSLLLVFVFCLLMCVSMLHVILVDGVKECTKRAAYVGVNHVESPIDTLFSDTSPPPSEKYSLI